MSDALENRNNLQVFEDHLWESNNGSVESDAKKNYSEKVILFTADGIFYGHQGLKDLAQKLKKELPNANFKYKTKLFEREIAFLEWTAETKDKKVMDGADSFLIKDGKILAQTIHYTVETK